MHLWKYSKIHLQRKSELSDNVVYKSLPTGRANICSQTPRKGKQKRKGKEYKPKLRFAVGHPHWLLSTLQSMKALVQRHTDTAPSRPVVPLNLPNIIRLNPSYMKY